MHKHQPEERGESQYRPCRQLSPPKQVSALGETWGREGKVGRGLPSIAAAALPALAGQLFLHKNHLQPPAPLSGCSAAPCQGATPV